MRKTSLIILCAVIAAIAIGCSEQQKKEFKVASTLSDGDSTIYGLVCEGSNDSIIVFLRDPYDGGDPDTLDILEASRQQRVFGTLRTGDRVAIMRNDSVATKASSVIVTQDLIGQWCYKVKPTLRRRVEMTGLSDEQVISSMDDSLKQLFEAEIEYGITLKTDSVAMPIGMRAAAAAADEQSPIEYPKLKFYRQWYVRNGRLLLVEMRLDSLGNTVPAATDTAELVLLTPDSLVLRIDSVENGYYRKQLTDDVAGGKKD